MLPDGGFLGATAVYLYTVLQIHIECTHAHTQMEVMVQKKGSWTNASFF
jgi:hypothetical protein